MNPVIISIDGTMATMSNGENWWLNGPMQTRPQDWAPRARAILWPDRQES